MKLTGRLSGEGKLKGRATSDGNGHVQVKTEKSRIRPEDYYTGTYEVVPDTVRQVLRTKDKHMTEDVKIKEIPYFETSNARGGKTIYIREKI